MDDYNSDWGATCAIYNLEVDDVESSNPAAASSGRTALEERKRSDVETFDAETSCDWCGSLQLNVQVHDTIFVRGPFLNPLAPPPKNGAKRRRFRNRPNPVFCYKIVDQATEAPTLRVNFGYQYHVDEGPTTVHVSVETMPDLFEPYAYDWIPWLNRQATQILTEEECSFAVCQFLEYQALEFFHAVHKVDQPDITLQPITVMVSLCQEERDCPTEKELSKDGFVHWSIQPCTIASSQESFSANAVQTPFSLTSTKVKADNKQSFNLNKMATEFISSHWKEWVTIECPICFAVVTASDAKDISCGHYFCRDCITTYSTMIVQELRLQRHNPFRCPMPKCKREMKIVKCVKTIVSEEDMDRIRYWLKQIKHPEASALLLCPRTKLCGVRGQMRQVDLESSLVYCEACNIQWCELCLKRVSQHQSHDRMDCDETQILEFARRYRAAKSPKIKQKCEEKWPWIAEYTIARLDEMETLQWIKENGCAMCPGCKAVIERSEGCFHMTCTQCETHFCYECGVNLFPPFYGTHHCWEKEALDEFND